MKKQIFPTSERGQSLVELAISLGVILMLLAGAINFGMALFSYVAIRDAAQEGAMYASLYPCIDPGTGVCGDNSSNIRQHVRSASTHPVDLAAFADDQILIEFTGGMCEGTTSGLVNGVKLTVKYDQPIVMPFAGIFFGGQVIPLSASVTDTILTPSCP